MSHSNGYADTFTETDSNTSDTPNSTAPSISEF